MEHVTAGPHGLILVQDQVRVGTDDRHLRSAMRRGELTRLRRGAYANAAELAADAAFDLRIAAVVGTRRMPVLLSHYAAARAWGLPIVGAWPLAVDITVDPRSGRRTKNGVTVHRHSIPADEIHHFDLGACTSLDRTLVDLARVAPFRDAVAALDAALRRGATSKLLLLDLLGDLGAIAGRSRAERAIEFASPLAQLPGESFSRVLMHELGFPPPVLQARFIVDGMTERFADFWWEDIHLIGEFDGKGKYVDPALTAGLSPEHIMWKEKLRENELRDLGASITRWTWADLIAVTPFIRRLEMAGLQRHKPAGKRR